MAACAGPRVCSHGELWMVIMTTTTPTVTCVLLSSSMFAPSFAYARRYVRPESRSAHHECDKLPTDRRSSAAPEASRCCFLNVHIGNSYIEWLCRCCSERSTGKYDIITVNVEHVRIRITKSLYTGCQHDWSQNTITFRRDMFIRNA